MKAWHVTDVHDILAADLVLADTAGKAKLASWMYRDLGTDFIDLRAKREPKLDGVETITPQLAHDAGYMVQCSACWEYIGDWGDRESIVFIDGRPYHASCAGDWV